ncbi:hypothetical protein ABMA28_016157 [Loxostege sticticalis]|uniref:Uncharacterized protein n=1 Tax=Loxostege sticticalis TaxID=481309 RepID=A0ABD0T7W7_LOXSC
MKICRPKSILSPSHLPGEITKQSAVTKFFMCAADFYLAVISNGLVVLGYVLGKIFCSDFQTSLSVNLLVIFGHSIALLSAAFTVLQDVLYVRQYRREFSVNKYYVIANILTIIGEYKELKSTLHGI